MKKIVKLKYPIPFYTQKVDNYIESGFSNLEEGSYWQDKGCGIVSLKMIIDGFLIYNNQHISDSYGKLLKKGLSIGGYCERGWIHKKLIKIAEIYNVHGEWHNNATAIDIKNSIDKNKPCIASVSVCFNPKVKGGHLIVILGYIEDNSKLTHLIVNHPSSEESCNYIQQEIEVRKFEKSFSGVYMDFYL